jgi:hypothetical protein
MYSQSSSDQVLKDTPPSLAVVIRLLLSVEEEEQISQQFEHACRRNCQVLWSGIPRELAQVWADERHLQTLTTAMGPLMDKDHPLCLSSIKSPRQWKTYIKGASALFAGYISRGERVVVLSPPPPERLHPTGGTSYQLIEEPIVKGSYGACSVGRIYMVHPTVSGAQDSGYQIWPSDETEKWIARFPTWVKKPRSWREIRTTPIMRQLMNVAITIDFSVGIESRAAATSPKGTSSGIIVYPTMKRMVDKAALRYWQSLANIMQKDGPKVAQAQNEKQSSKEPTTYAIQAQPKQVATGELAATGMQGPISKCFSKKKARKRKKRKRPLKEHSSTESTSEEKKESKEKKVSKQKVSQEKKSKEKKSKENKLEAKAKVKKSKQKG